MPAYIFPWLCGLLSIRPSLGEGEHIMAPTGLSCEYRSANPVPTEDSNGNAGFCNFHKVHNPTTNSRKTRPPLPRLLITLFIVLAVGNLHHIDIRVHRNKHIIPFLITLSLSHPGSILLRREFE